MPKVIKWLPTRLLMVRYNWFTFCFLTYSSLFGQLVVELAVRSMCATTWMCGARFGQKQFILCATTHQSELLIHYSSYIIKYCTHSLSFVLWLLINVVSPSLCFVLCRGNWWGYAPYKHGTPCSACPPSYGGVCRENLCYKGLELILQ